ncbi:MAG: hypothetical protein ACJZ16_01805 [Methylophilaceae bacterium]
MKFNIKTDSIMDISADIIIIAVNDKNQIINKSKLKPSCTTYLSNIISSKDLLGGCWINFVSARKQRF